MKRKQIRSTLVIEGREANKAFTTSLIPSSLEITLSGLKPLNALKAFRDFIASRFTLKIASP